MPNTSNTRSTSFAARAATLETENSVTLTREVEEDVTPLIALGMSLTPKAAISTRKEFANQTPDALGANQTPLANATFDIKAKYAQLGGAGGFLGAPLFSSIQTTPDGAGFYMHYQGGGSIYWAPNVGAFSVHGAIRDKWAAMGWERSFLGYPLTDETGTPDGVGRFNHFQGGSIYWTPSTGAHEVHGAIRDKWAQMGWERSYLGYPVSDELAQGNTARVSQFQRGSITWTPATGAQPTASSLHFHDAVTSKEPLGGWVDITLNGLGDYTFAGHLHDSGFDNISYTLSAVLVAPNGTGIGFQRSGHTEGTVAGLPFGTPNRDDDFSKPDFNQRISDHWSEFTNASLFWRLDGTDTLTESLGQLLSDLANQGIKALGSAASQALVALIFA